MYKVVVKDRATATQLIPLHANLILDCYTALVFQLTEEKIFMAGMWWRMVYGILRILFGLAVLKVVGMPLVDVVTTLMGHELVEDPNDMLYVFFSHILAGHPLYISYFFSIYFIFWGILDVVLSYNLIKHRLWAFPASFILIGSFILYESVRFAGNHSLILFSAMLIDISILWLVWREYKRLSYRSVN